MVHELGHQPWARQGAREMCFCLNYDVNYKWEVFDISMFTPPENGVYGLDEGDLIYVLDNQFSS